VGLAAGFDKDAEIVLGLPDLGFGFAEIGTVTPRPQAGNPRPRLFRDAATASLFNRMGFNGLGAELVASRLREAREKSHARFPSSFRVGVNIGKNKDTPNEEAVADFLAAARPFREIADYLVVNVSSPNTPGLRSLQSVQALRPIALGLKELVGGWRRTPPVLLKLAPEIRGEDLRVLLEAAESWGVDGFVLTNTLAGTWPAPGGELLGGWSGGALTAASRESLLSALRWTSRPVISVGGILSEDEAVSRLRAGASLVQLYSGWVFRGPGFPTRIRRAWESR
jgi:dihydroorotate dehydrogenase